MASEAQAMQLRNTMVDKLIFEGTMASPQVEAAMRTVPRELFAPGVDLRDVYDPHSAVVIKRNLAGNVLSSVSAPEVQAYMLEQADITEGMRVLEIGSGGYNASLLAELVGDSGSVTTVDIDVEITRRAGEFIREAGYDHIVNTVLADGGGHFSDNGQAPYDRILVTAGAGDVTPNWVAMLKSGGRLIVPLLIRGLPRTIAFYKAHKCLVGRSSRLFGFLPMRGKVSGPRTGMSLATRGNEIVMYFDDDTSVDPSTLRGVFDTPRIEVWTGVTIGRFEPWAGVHMWLATQLPGFCRLAVKSRENELISPPGQHLNASACVDNGNLAYVTTRAAANNTDVELGVHAFGPEASAVAENVADQLCIWARKHRANEPQFRVYPAGTADDDMAPYDRVIDRLNSRITISWLASA